MIQTNLLWQTVANLLFSELEGLGMIRVTTRLAHFEDRPVLAGCSLAASRFGFRFLVQIEVPAQSHQCKDGFDSLKHRQKDLIGIQTVCHDHLGTISSLSI